MPELPEVETIKRILAKDVTGLTIKDVHVLYKRLIQTDLEAFCRDIKDKKILSLGRKGKYLIFHLSDSFALLVHFRMEGKFFHLTDLESNLNKHVSLYFTMDDGSYLIFNDVRKFGVMYLYKEEELKDCKPFKEMGLEPWDIPGPSYLLEAYKNKSYMLKEAMLDQGVISGLGNIYADEVLFRSGLSPFRPASSLTEEEAKRVIANAIQVLKQAIENGGSTIRTYHPAQGVSGSMQTNLMAYGREGQPCLKCGTLMEKRYVGGRGTTYCPNCQHVSPSIAVTGKIAVGKSQVTNEFKKLGCYTASADDMVKELLAKPAFLSQLQKKFPAVFDGEKLNKAKVMEQMASDKKFCRSYDVFIWSAVRDEINSFLINHADKPTVIEVPLLFDAKMDEDFTYIVGVESSRQKEHLELRGDSQVDQHLELGKKNSYDFNRKKLDFTIVNNGSMEELNAAVDQAYEQITKPTCHTCK
jgi:formamidopyrimidine-DNA glycosylase